MIPNAAAGLITPFSIHIPSSTHAFYTIRAGTTKCTSKCVSERKTWKIHSRATEII